MLAAKISCFHIYESIWTFKTREISFILVLEIIFHIPQIICRYSAEISNCTNCVCGSFMIYSCLHQFNTNTLRSLQGNLATDYYFPFTYIKNLIFSLLHSALIENGFWVLISPNLLLLYFAYVIC